MPTTRTLRLIEAYEVGRLRPRTAWFNVVEAEFVRLVRDCGGVRVKGISYSYVAAENTVYRQDTVRAKARNAAARKHKGKRDMDGSGKAAHRVVGLPRGYVVSDANVASGEWI